MYPLLRWKEYPRTLKFKQPYPKNFGSLSGQPHLGIDIITPEGVPIVAPFDCLVVASKGTQSGNLVYVYWDKFVMRCLHLQKPARSGEFKKGQIIGYTGNTGSVTTNAHVHIDLSHKPFQLKNINNFVDPETFNWINGEDSMDKDQEIARLKKILADYKAKAQDYANRLKEKPKTVVTKLDGNKSYLAIIIGVIYTLLVQNGVLERQPELEVALVGFLGIGFRSAIKKLEK